MANIAIIPARAGSKGVKNKNIIKLAGKSLVHRAIDWARASGVFDKIILTTDIEQYRFEYRDSKDITLRERAPELCTDTAMMSDVVTDCIKEYDLHNDAMLWLLQPSSPFREEHDASQILRLLEAKGAESLISIAEVTEHPSRMYTVVNGHLYRMKHTDFENRQNLKRCYIRNGCYYVTKVHQFRTSENWYARPSAAYTMPWYSGIHIDVPFDVTKADVFIREYKWPKQKYM